MNNQVVIYKLASALSFAAQATHQAKMPVPAKNCGELVPLLHIEGYLRSANFQLSTLLRLIERGWGEK